MDGRTVEFLSAGIPATIVPLPDGLPAQGERLRLDRVQLLKLRSALAALSLPRFFRSGKVRKFKFQVKFVSFNKFEIEVQPASFFAAQE